MDENASMNAAGHTDREKLFYTLSVTKGAEVFNCDFGGFEEICIPAEEEVRSINNQSCQ